uniref:Uncharacterized protein n=1 Tax=Romanomermis culicivorax TaxID=13658 RepID=A0A915JHA6_ROMCU
MPWPIHASVGRDNRASIHRRSFRFRNSTITAKNQSTRSIVIFLKYSNLNYFQSKNIAIFKSWTKSENSKTALNDDSIGFFTNSISKSKNQNSFFGSRESKMVAKQTPQSLKFLDVKFSKADFSKFDIKWRQNSSHCSKDQNFEPEITPQTNSEAKRCSHNLDDLTNFSIMGLKCWIHCGPNNS